MKDPVQHWHAEHANFSRLLDILEKQLDAFHAGEKPNYELMIDIVSYLRHYPDLHHHPREDAAFALVARRDPAMKLSLSRLQQEHRVIAAAGEDLLKALNEVESDAMIARAAVESIAAVYLVYYRHHIANEEREVLPRAKKLLTDKDWEAVAAAAPAGRDPLFGNMGDAGYRELRRHILLEAQPD
ncbi:MAG TPA: hemerythrin domain-containing protein [Burkholderiales bacterium]|nr:hemerythrin domain-containing protein [Burkholderiales bacterium]